jgi:Cu-Zn family superoxide dismutase
MKKLALLVTLSALFVLACPPAEEPPAPEPAAPEPAAAEPAPAPPTAEAVLLDAEGVEVGRATFTQQGSDVVLVATVEGTELEGLHGLHVHEFGLCEAPDFASAGGHFNPTGTEHGCPPSPDRHAGDFGNIELVGGSGRLELASDLVTVTEGERSVVGKAVILHGHTDDCTTQPTGDAGPRWACGVVELVP